MLRRPRASSGAPRLGLLTRFGLISFVLIVGLGVVVGLRLQRSLEERTVDDAIRSAEIATRVGIVPAITNDDLSRNFVPLDDQRRSEIDARLRSAVSANGIVRLKIWNAQHWIVYSDNARLVGRWFPSDPLLARSLNGETVSTVTDLSRPEELEEKTFGSLLAVYVPLRVDADGNFVESTSGSADDGSASTGEVVGAFEVYLPYAPIAAQIESGTRQLWLTLAIGLVVLYLALFRLVAGASRLLRRQATDNDRLARTDQLTGLANRVRFVEEVDRMVSDRLVVLMMDLDRFQEINDTLGHTTGDEVLKVLAQRLLATIGEAGVVARFGGDEFAVAAPIDSDLAADALITRVAAAVVAPVSVAGVSLELAASIGAAAAPEHGRDADALVRRADVAMYHAKRNRLGVARYSQTIDEHTPERLALAGVLREAIDRGQMFLVYQPKLGLTDNGVVGVEALVRWRHPERGIVPPADFLPVVESTDLIRPLTIDVLEQALDQAARWRAAGRSIKVAVNLSTRMCEDMAIVTVIGRALQARSLPAEVLEVELTESSLVQNPAALAKVLNRIHDLGVTIAIDDFGTGYASLSYLTSLPVDVVKIDREFVADVCSNEQHAAVVQFTSELGRTFGMKVVAEGVEDVETLDRLRELGVDLAQGYLISRPVEADVLDEWLRRHELLQRTIPREPESLEVGASS